MKRVLITGMSGTGKSSVIRELAARGHKAIESVEPLLLRSATLRIDTALSPEPRSQPGLTFESVRVGAIDRRFGVAGRGSPGAPLLIALHGRGIGPNVMAAWTGLAERGPAAGFTTVFPDGLSQTWDDVGGGRVDGADDAAFIAALSERLSPASGRVFLVGLSNGACFAERLARHGLATVEGIALVSGTAREASRESRPRPLRPCAVLSIVGTADPLVPYAGGPARGLAGWLARHRPSPVIGSGGRASVAPELLAADWAAVNCGGRGPALPERTGDPTIERLTWCSPAEPVELIRIIGGGHGWPGGPQYAPRFLVGRISPSFDATGAVLDFFSRLVARPAPLR